MPAAYFNALGANDDLALLPKTIRTSEELAELAEVVEQEILAQFTQSAANAPCGSFDATEYEPQLQPSGLSGAVPLGDGMWVCLRGYAVDPAQATGTFKEAMRREIAHVLKWRVPQAKRKPGVASDGDGDQSIAFRDNADEPFPASFPLYLRPFIIAPVTWGL